MTYEQADKIVRCSNYTKRGLAMVNLGLIKQSTYEFDYNGTSKALGKIQNDKTLAIKLAIAIQDIK